jgi:hypothetical protein
MISTGIFPTRLKYAEIKPLYKKGDLANISSYRPISLLTSFSKIFEKITYNKLIRHLNYNHILADEQFGFRTNSSMDLASYKLINDILMSLLEAFFVIYKKLLIVSIMNCYYKKCTGMASQAKDQFNSILFEKQISKSNYN